MSNLMQFLGGGAFTPKSMARGTFKVSNDTTNGPSWGTTVVGYERDRKLTPVLSGACTANTLKTLLNISGPGTLAALVIAHKDATSRTYRFKITLDGVVVFDQTSEASTWQDMAAIVIGAGVHATTNYWTMIEDRIDFSSSLLVEYASSLTETDKTSIGYVYYTR